MRSIELFFATSLGVVVVAACGGSVKSSGGNAGNGSGSASSSSSSGIGGSSGSGSGTSTGGGIGSSSGFSSSGGSGSGGGAGMFNITCQSAMDCRGGEVCCFSFMTGGGGFGGGGGSQCQAGACPMGGFQLCAGSNSGCPMGETCTAAPGGMGHYCAAGSGAPDGSTAAGDDASTAADAAAVCTASCTGCCDWGSPTARRNGACVAGTQDTLCGNMGGACQDCTSFGAFCGSGVCNRPGTATDAASE